MTAVFISGATPQRVVTLPPVCVKTGVPTSHRVRMRGSAYPAWTVVLVVFSVFAWIIASAMTSRRYEMVVAFDRDRWRRWRALRELSWVLGFGGLALGFFYGNLGLPNYWIPFAVSASGITLGITNGLVNNIGIRHADNGVVLTRVHPDFRRAVLEPRAGAELPPT